MEARTAAARSFLALSLSSLSVDSERPFCAPSVSRPPPSQALSTALLFPATPILRLSAVCCSCSFASPCFLSDSFFFLPLAFKNCNISGLRSDVISSSPSCIWESDMAAIIRSASLGRASDDEEDGGGPENEEEAAAVAEDRPRGRVPPNAPASGLLTALEGPRVFVVPAPPLPFRARDPTGASRLGKPPAVPPMNLEPEPPPP
mmetsp:Transcript_48807/g.147067  ORF Transcript_48807/g.147067 Transcript_48807/m.147067 type:complete len:204 (-) Transcript_48807:323-934(-)